MTKLEKLLQSKANAESTKDLQETEREQILEVINKKIALEQKKMAKDAPKKEVKTPPETTKTPEKLDENHLRYSKEKIEAHKEKMDKAAKDKNAVMYEKLREELKEMQSENRITKRVYESQAETTKTPEKVVEKPTEKMEKPQETPKTVSSSSTGVEQCKTIIADFNAAKRAKEADEVRQKMVKEADTQKAIEEVKKLSDSQILASAKPKVRIDVFSREQLENLAVKNIKIRLANLPQKDKKEVPKDKILSLAVDLYKILDKKIDELLK